MEFIVTTLEDETSENGTLSLREAVAQANQSDGADNITFDSTLPSGQLRLIQGVIEISDSVTINGSGHITITGDAAGDDILTEDGLSDARRNSFPINEGVLVDNTKILMISNADVNLIGLTLTGGGVSGEGDLTVRDSTLGGIHDGAVAIDGDLTVRDSTLVGISDGAVDIDGDLTIIGSEVRNNFASYSAVRGRTPVIEVQGDIIIANSTLSGNTTGDENFDGFLTTAYGSITLFQTTVVDNGGRQGGEGIAVSGGMSIFNSVIAGNITTSYGNAAGDYRNYEAGISLRDNIPGGLEIYNSIIGFTPSGRPLRDNLTISDSVFVTTLRSEETSDGNVGARLIFAETTGREFRIPVLTAEEGDILTAALHPFTNNPAIDAGTGTLLSEVDLGVDVDGDGAISTDPITLDANGNLRLVGKAVDLGPVELQTAPTFAPLRIFGDDNANMLADSADADIMFGRAGNDTFVMSADGSGDHIKDFETGIDRVNISAWGISSFEELEVREHKSGKLFITAGAEFLALRSSDGGQLSVTDLNSNSFIFADIEREPDAVRLVQGSDGPDRLFGTALMDRIVDGGDIDNLFGRSGADTFVLVADGANDNIKDFEVGVDLIDLSAWGVTSFADLTLDQKNEGKVIVSFADEALAIQDLGSQFSLEMLTSENFIFAS